MSGESIGSTVAGIIGGGPSAAKEESIVEKVKDFFMDIHKSMQNPKNAFEVFEKNLVFLKGFFLVFFIILAIVNYSKHSDIGLISKKPGLFALESFIFGASAVVPFLLMCYLRNENMYSAKSITIISCVLCVSFFVLNYLLEVGGLYAATFYESEEKAKKEPEEDSYSTKLNKSVSTSSNIIVIGMIVGSLIALLFAASFVKDFSPEYVRLKSVPTPVMFGIEMILFGVISAVPIYFMAFNRDALSAHTTKEFLMITVKFAVLHCVLQASGFYRYMFTGKL